MADFPSIRTSDWTLFKEVRKRAQVKSPFESGAVQSRPRHTSSRWAFEIGWNWITDDDYALLVTHFDENQGGAFNWTHILTGATHSVRYVEDALPEAVPIGTDYFSLKGLRLEEA